MNSQKQEREMKDFEQRASLHLDSHEIQSSDDNEKQKPENTNQNQEKVNQLVQYN